MHEWPWRAGWRARAVCMPAPALRRVMVASAVAALALAVVSRSMSAPPAGIPQGNGFEGDLDGLGAWLEEGGADLSKVRVGAGNLGERGVLTAVGIGAGEVILRIPLNKAINTGPMSVTASEAAVKLLREAFKRKSQRLPYVRSLPPPGSCDTLDLWGDRALAALPLELAQQAGERKQWAAKVFNESVRGKDKLFGGRAISFELFSHAVCLVSSRTLGVRNSNGDTQKFLLPFVDLINHNAELGPLNTVRLAASEHGIGPTHIEVVAGASITADSEIFISYGKTHTPDETLAHYGFVEGVASTVSGATMLPLCTAHRSPSLDLMSLRGRTIRGKELAAELARLVALADDVAERRRASTATVTPAATAAIVQTYWDECHARLRLAIASLRSRNAHGATTHGGPQGHGPGEL